MYYFSCCREELGCVFVSSHVSGAGKTYKALRSHRHVVDSEDGAIALEFTNS